MELSRKNFAIFFAFGAGFSASMPVYAEKTPDFLVGSEWERVAIAENVDPLLLYSVSMMESSRYIDGEHLSYPHPYTIRNPAGSFYYETRDQAANALRESLDQYKPWEIDVCAMQINLKWHGHRVNGDFEKLLDLDTCLTVGSQVLKSAMGSTDGSELAIRIGRYHSWKDPVARYYGTVVLNVMDLLRRYDGAI